MDGDGQVANDPTLAVHNITAAERVQAPELDHRIASVFWEFMNSEAVVWEDEAFIDDLLFPNPYYATGFPVTEAYWSAVLVAGIPQDVLWQCFQRRCLTYTPGNAAGWKVEAPEATMFLWAAIPERFADLGAVSFAARLLEEAGVAVAPGVGFGQAGEGHVRFSLIEPDERAQAACRAIGAFLKRA